MEAQDTLVNKAGTEAAVEAATTVPVFAQLVPTRLPVLVRLVDGTTVSHWGWKWDEATPRVVTAQVRQAWRDAPRDADTVTEVHDPETKLPVLDKDGNARVVIERGGVTELGLETVRTLVLCALVPDLSPLDAEKLGSEMVDGIFRYLDYIKADAPAPKASETTDQTA
jgi:hypothetical protein